MAYLVDEEAMRSVLSFFSMPNKSCITLDLFGCPIFATLLLEATALLDVVEELESWFLPDIIAVEPALLQAEAVTVEAAVLLAAAAPLPSLTVA